MFVLYARKSIIQTWNIVSEALNMYMSVSDTKKTTNTKKKQTAYKTNPSYVKRNDNPEMESLTMEQVCDLLSVSSATVRNWLRLGKLKTETDGKSFNKNHIENIFEEIKNGKDAKLKSRRNKKHASGKGLYKDYIKNENNREVAENILSACESISEDELRIILAHFALQLHAQNSKSTFNSDWLYKNVPFSDHSLFHMLISDLLGDVDLAITDLSNIQVILDLQIQFVPSEDTLGFIYLSLRDLRDRKQTGAYYTPATAVNMLIDQLSDCLTLEHKTVCDPCCGTGIFLIALINHGIPADHLYGQDIDEISILITRINMFLLNKHFTKEQLYSQFVCGNALESTDAKTFSVVLGNPPWGYDFSKEETASLLSKYRTAKSKGTESFDLFIEKGLQLLEKDGYMAYVLPEALLNISSHLQARELILEKTSFKFISYLGNVFPGVQCPSIILGVQKDGQGNTKQCKVSFNNQTFTISENRKMDASLFSFNINNDEYNCLKAITFIENTRYLAGNAIFALGIVTGDNKKYITNTKDDGFEVILKGSDILRYSTKAPCNYIQFTPESFQQVAPIEIYRAEEKLLYRFICEVPVFTYDNQQTLSLNSCNILIPQIEGMHIKYVLAVLNSSVAAFFITKKYNSIKLLRSYIETLPIPMVSMEKQNEIIKKVDHIMYSKENMRGLYEELDNDIMDIYQLLPGQRKTIMAALGNKNLFLT